jgi:hypothetical protein
MAGVTPPISVTKIPYRTRGLVVDHRDNARIEELNNLRLALATFALHLDAFEMKVSKAKLGLTPASRPTSVSAAPASPASTNTAPASPARPRDIGGRLQKENRIGRR